MRTRRRNGQRSDPGPSQPPTLPRLLVRRAPLVLLVMVIAGVAAWGLVRGDARQYEHTAAFLVRPSDNISDEDVPDALRSLGTQYAQTVNNVAQVLASERFVEDVAASRNADLSAGYEATATIRPGSDVIELTIRGPDPDVLATVADAYSVVGVRWVADTYRAYEMDFLGGQASDGPVAPNVSQTVTLAALLGAVIALGAVFVEARARRGRSDVPPADEPAATAEEPRLLVSVDDVTGRVERLEAILQSQLRDGEKVVRIGPRRLGIVAEPQPTVTPRRQSR